MLGSVALLHKHLTVTKSLTVEFLKPVPINQPLLGRSWNDRIEGRHWYNLGEITLAATGVSDGDLVHGVRFGAAQVETQTIVLRGHCRTQRVIGSTLDVEARVKRIPGSGY